MEMESIRLEGKIKDNESSLIIPIGDLRVMLLSEDVNGDGIIEKTQIFVYNKYNSPSNNINIKVFGQETVNCDSETLDDALNYCKLVLKRSLTK